ncbi:MAG: translation initiation factor IF-2 [Alphaproteobacteria bacterium]|nr:translation initiation factor IF-2 [Alphaproteobacteria bacterium]
MTSTKEQDGSSRISLNKTGGSRLELKKRVDTGVVRQSFSHGRSKSVAVEVKRKRAPAKSDAEGAGGATARQADAAGGAAPRGRGREARTGGSGAGGPVVLKPLTDNEKSARVRALADSKKAEDEARKRAEENARRVAEESQRKAAEEEAARGRKEQEEARRKAEDEARKKAEEAAARLLAKEEEERQKREADEVAAVASASEPAAPASTAVAAPAAKPAADADREERPTRSRPAVESRGKGKGGSKTGRDTEGRSDGRGGRGSRRDGQRGGRLMLDSNAEVIERRAPSLAAMRRHREREKRQQQMQEQLPIVREVVLPETIQVSELANRMAVRGADVIKSLMKMGVMATVNQTVDADTAEVVVTEFGHTVKRVAESDVEIGLEGLDDEEGDLQPRAPVVTVMGHVDHGKTSLLDALRKADVVSGEAGGITQHIGAYQVDIGAGQKVTFIDTPGHAAFTEMRARGADVTDIVILVVAADDGVMPQTKEAINHAKAAKVPIVVAINKIDRAEANPDRVKQELLGEEVVLEEFGGDVLAVEVSATEKIGLDKLIEGVLLQAELLELSANPVRSAQGAVIEARLDRGRGVVATALIQKGTLNVGEIIVCGGHWGRARALIDDHGQNIVKAGPSTPVEILGLDGVPDAGDLLVVVENEKRAREITEYRLRKKHTAGLVAPAGTVEDMFSQMAEQNIGELPVVVKSDVHGSLEAIVAGLIKLNTDEVQVRVLHSGVGAITESDVTLAMASRALILGFNVRANAQARELSKREGIDIQYHSIIYELLDEAKARLSGMLAPASREQTTGHAEIREVFTITKIGKIAGCMVTDGIIRRGARFRLLRDDVVIHDGALGSLRRFKDDTKEVREGFECGIGLDTFNDIRQGDVIEAYEVEEVARTL